MLRSSVLRRSNGNKNEVEEMKEQIDKMLEYNKVFVEHELYKKYTTPK